MTVEETLELVRLVLAAYPAKRYGMNEKDAKAMVAAYHAGLGDIDIERVTAAATRAIRTLKEIPSVADIRELVGVVSVGERRSGIQAWGDIARMRQFRNGDALKDFDPLVVKVCKDFRWIEWRTLFRGDDEVQQWIVVTGENEAADRARFAEAYDNASKSARREAQASNGAGAKALPAPSHALSANGEVFNPDEIVTSFASKLTGAPR